MTSSNSPTSPLDRWIWVLTALVLGVLAAPAAAAPGSSASGVASDAIVATASARVASGVLGAADSRSTPVSGAVIVAGSADVAVGRPAPPGLAHGSSVARAGFDEAVATVGRSAFPAAAAPAALAQLASGGSFVAASGHPATVAPRAPARRAIARAHPARRPVRVPFTPALEFPRTTDPVVAVSVPLVGVFVGSATTARRFAVRSARPTAPPVGPAGLGPATLAPFDSGLLGRSPAGVLLGGGPFSSSGAAAAALELTSLMLAAAVLLCGLAWRRRAWDPVFFSGQSVLLGGGLERPG